ncbi:hypothetical protein NP493_609g01025 [Ridgeia piscesae]|uniref:Uncharacterized protein n=1 Tax=Ridgeia piscesae TaxID=27915 RepID=A0AAD9KTM4_RIDPI|nr:hypothetical protein NP493_609g01025 [Ridgeia piscesae]
MNLSELFTIYVEFVFLDALCSTSACRDLVKTYFHDDLDTNSPDSSPSSPHSGSQGSQGSVGGEVHTPQKEGQDGATTFPLQMMSKMVINQSMPNISIGQPRDTSAAEASDQLISEYL